MPDDPPALLPVEAAEIPELPNLPLEATRAGRDAKAAGDPREPPPMWANSPYFAFWLAGYDL